MQKATTQLIANFWPIIYLAIQVSNEPGDVSVYCYSKNMNHWPSVPRHDYKFERFIKNALCVGGVY